MPSIEQSLIPVAQYPNLFASPFGNDGVPKFYSSIPVPSSNPGSCLPCVICGATAANWSATLTQIVENAPSQGVTTSASIAFSPPPDCCLYPAIGFGSLFTETGLPDSVNVNSVLLDRVGSAYGDTTNGVRIESGLWAVYQSGVRTTQQCLIAGLVTDSFLGTYLLGGVDTLTRASSCRWTGTDVNGCAIILYWDDLAANWVVSKCSTSCSSITGSSNPLGTYSCEGGGTIAVANPAPVLLETINMGATFPNDYNNYPIGWYHGNAAGVTFGPYSADRWVYSHVANPCCVDDQLYLNGSAIGGFGCIFGGATTLLLVLTAGTPLNVNVMNLVNSSWCYALGELRLYDKAL